MTVLPVLQVQSLYFHSPAIGEINLVTKDEWSAWTGGKFNNIWTGLASSIALLEHTSPNQLHPVYVAFCSYNFRKTGHKIYFKSMDDLISSRVVIGNISLKDTGMDSIAYLRDQTDDTAVTNVIKAHTWYTAQSETLERTEITSQVTRAFESTSTRDLSYDPNSVYENM
ncbi:hypothetical protein MHU86_18366 [Fragilaria crotonensis]|nr:hypothetical protein MHU86_18366 [Fragilaria crotonensis]